MYADVVDLRSFYESRLGQVARHLVRRRIREFWPDLNGLSILGLGYATPYLRQFMGEAERVIAMMPAQQGVHRWPSEGPNKVALAEMEDLPLPDMSVDRVLLVHGLEGADDLSDLLREVWRVMAADGRLLVAVPNRRGLWARSDRTPFGQGHPYSSTQLTQLLRAHMFLPIQSGTALFMPPVHSPALLATAPAWERIGLRWFPRFAGLTVIEAGKQIYSTSVARRRRRMRRPVIVPFPQPARPGLIPTPRVSRPVSE